MTNEETIDWINSIVKYRIAPRAHGVGVVAMRDIPKNIKLFADMFPKAYQIPAGSLNKLFPDVKKLLTEKWPKMALGKAFMWPDVFFQAYMNHSDDPNYDCVLDVAIRDIKEGEEITEDYRNIEGWDKVFDFIKV